MLFRSGESFGELMLSGERRAATVQWTVRARLKHVGRAEVERVLATRPDLARHLIERLIQRLARRVRTLTSTVSQLVSVGVYGRLLQDLARGGDTQVSRACIVLLR